jgi:amino acid transporter
MVSMLGLSTTLMLTWEGILVFVPPTSSRFKPWLKFFRYFGSGLSNGGSAGLITSFFLSWFGFLAVMTSMAELASMAPTSAGQYHWVYMLAPRSTRKLLSYLTGKTFLVLAYLETKLTLNTSRRMVNDCCLAIYGSDVWCFMRNSHPRPSCAQLSQYL